MESQSYSNELELSVNNFLDYCANYRNLSNYTLRNYDSDLNHFLEYLKSESKINIIDLDRSAVRKYVNLLNDLDSKITPILYGGSVSSQNAKELILIDGVNGFLIGGASLDVI